MYTVQTNAGEIIIGSKEEITIALQHKKMLGSKFVAVLLVLCLAVTNVRADSSDDTEISVALPQWRASDDKRAMSNATVRDTGGEEQNGDGVGGTIDPHDVRTVSAMENGVLQRSSSYPQPSNSRCGIKKICCVIITPLYVLLGLFVTLKLKLDAHDAKPCTDFIPNRDNVNTATVEEEETNLWALRDGDTKALLYYIKKEGESPDAKYEIFTENEQDDIWYLQQSDDDFVGNFGPGMEDVVVQGSEMRLALNDVLYDSTYDSNGLLPRTWTFAANDNDISDEAVISEYSTTDPFWFKLCTALDEDAEKKKALLGVLTSMIQKDSYSFFK